MTLATAVRAARAAALLTAFQSAKGTPATDFSTGGERLWTDSAEAWVSPEMELNRFADADLGPAAGARIIPPDQPRGGISCKGTRAALLRLLTSNFGAYSGGAFTLATGISTDRWLTLGWAEDALLGAASAARLVRVQDAWMHRLALSWEAQGAHKALALNGSYAGRKVFVQAQSAGGITFPATHMDPSDRTPFPSAQTTLVRDPAGTPVSLRFRSLQVLFDQGLAHKWDAGAGLFDVFKAGPCRAQLAFSSDYSDETWALIDLARAHTAARFRIQSTSEAGKVLTIDLWNVVLEILPGGHDGQGYAEFRAAGEASASAGNFVSVTLT